VSNDLDTGGIVTEFEKTFAMFSHISGKLHEIDLKLANADLDVDEWTLPGGPLQTVYNVQRNYYQPIVVEYILATFPVASTSVTIQLGNRIIPVNNVAAGIFQADVKQQLEWDDIRSLTIAPATPNGYLEVMGHVSRKERDHR
jgi:hypothetical protein